MKYNYLKNLFMKYYNIHLLFFINGLKEIGLHHHNGLNQDLYILEVMLHALGDRHLENIMIHTNTGECVNIDFDCLFDKAKSFKVPEQVPFRLTRNIIDGFGICGIEGVFRRSCEIVLHILRENKDVILNTLHSFVYDPLIDHNMMQSFIIQQSSYNCYANEDIHVTRAPSDQQLNKEAEAAKTCLYNVKLRLNGHVAVRKPNYPCPVYDSTSIALSVQGQVQQLIDQATEINALSKMFPGWMPFL
ncbi:Phosphatidylinositol 3- and 4-kinase family protein [Reticulomyxa filosa]|uniref:Phosphatidylinositol 3-and 4-kinase family protein n=1 Tax=Reticulomyxa filosa TaxID=46433 RepID=X6L796_RETFI|nr:Phosphatidylinositol 3- and 4-kinase family protein [Reticulomyxa filosa]|eukprot:ETN97180.1 Phosphatidylinositol 3- and 4-kinase family protein [Reticulomyxa filosa]